MSYINQPCEKCGKKDKPVYERYPVTSEMTLKFKAIPMGRKQYKIVPEGMQWLCNDCADMQIENEKVEIKD